MRTHPADLPNSVEGVIALRNTSKGLSINFGLAASCSFAVMLAGTPAPRINLSDTRPHITRLPAASEAAVRFEELRRTELLEPLSLVSADFDGDGLPDVVSGYGSPEGGFLLVNRSDPQFLFSKGGEPGEAGEHPSPFQSEAEVLPLPHRPDYLVAGDFDGNGHPDLVSAEHRTSALHVSLGEGRARFRGPEEVRIDGQLTALVAGEMDRTDGIADLAAGVLSSQGPEVWVFRGSGGEIGQPAQRFSVPDVPTDLVLGQLDPACEMDMGVAAGNHLVIIRGRLRGRESGADPELRSQFDFQHPILALASGNFAEADGRELAVLLEDGSIELLSGVDPTTSQSIQFRKATRTVIDAATSWSPVRRTQLLATQVSAGSLDDLLLVEPMFSQIEILRAPRSQTRFDSLQGSSQTIFRLRTLHRPVSLLPLHLNRDAFTDLLILQNGIESIAYIETQGAGVSVNNDGDEDDADLSDGTCDADADPLVVRCTLRAAIRQSNEDGTPTTITFDRPMTIAPSGGLPSVTVPVTIDGGASIGGAKRVQIRSRLNLNGGNSTVMNLAVDGLEFSLEDNNRVFSNFVGTNPEGTAASGGGLGIRFASSSEGNTVGGTSEQLRNVISGNLAWGLQLDSEGNTVQGNYIGTDRNGEEALTNGSGGISSAGRNIIGGTEEGAGNLVSGNSGSGDNAINSVGIQVGGVCDTIQGNIIGADRSGTFALGNGENGLEIRGDHHLIGGTVPAAGNIISANGFLTTCRFPTAITCNRDDGIHIRRNSTEGILVRGNFIGTNRNGDSLPNAANGISIVGPKDCEIGGIEPDASNEIRFNGNHGILIDGPATSGTSVENNTIDSNGGDGVRLSFTSDHQILDNRIRSNGKNGVQVCDEGTGREISGNEISENSLLGLDLSTFCNEDGVTGNDTGDADSGPNNLQNFPVLGRIADTANIEGVLSSTPNTTFTIELFSNDQCDPLGFGEGQNLLDSFSVTTDDTGNVTFIIGNVPDGQAITATATDPDGNTSEFSACAVIPEIEPFVVNSVFDFSDEDAEDDQFDGVCNTGIQVSDINQSCNPGIEGDCACTLRAAIEEANARVGQDRIEFNIEAPVATKGTGGLVWTIFPQGSLPVITDPVVIDGYNELMGARRATDTEPAVIVIELDGSGGAGPEGQGLQVTGGFSRIEGLSVNSFARYGIVLASDANTVIGNHIGLDASGTIKKGNGLTGIWIDDSQDNCIGGTREGTGPCDLDSASRNVISGNDLGIWIAGPNATGNRVVGNIIGADSSGQIPLGNTGEGARITLGSRNVFGPGNLVAGQCCAIGNANPVGLILERATQNDVIGNRFGVDRNLRNSRSIVLTDSAANNIGGSEAFDGNVIVSDEGVSSTGSFRPALTILGSQSLDNRVVNNRIENNRGFGLAIGDGASGTIVGGLEGGGNTISGNGRAGIVVNSFRGQEPVGNSLFSNVVSDNGELGISFEERGEDRTYNDLRLDSDQGPNLKQNYPDLTLVTQFENTVFIRGNLRSKKDSTFRIQLFSNQACDSSGFGEGQTALPVDNDARHITVETNGEGMGSFEARVGRNSTPGDWIVATATDSAGNTSEFSRCQQVQIDADGDGSGVDIDPDDSDPGTMAVTDANGNRVVITARENDLLSALSVVEQVIPGTNRDFGIPNGIQIRLVTLLVGQNDGIVPRGQPGSTTITILLPAGFQVDSYFNYGPTPDNGDDHHYEFLFDGGTGAEIFEDRVVLHFIDGQRGDHDLTVNGEILTQGGPVTRTSRFFFPQVGDGVAGSIQFQSSLVFENTAGISPLRIEFFDPEGDFLNLELGKLGESSLFELVLDPGQSLSAKTPGEDSLQIGYAEVIGTGGLGGTAVFSRTDAATEELLFEAGVPASEPLTDFSLFVDTIGNRDTGLALVYPAATNSAEQAFPDAQITLRLYDSSFSLLATESVELAPSNHLARFVPELFPQLAQAAEMQGSLTVESDQALVAVTLRQNDDPARGFPDDVPTLTTFPVIPGRAELAIADQARPSQMENQVFFFPQVGDGAAGSIRFQTGLIFVNAGAATEIDLDFFDSTGGPLSIDLGSAGTNSSFQFNLTAGASLSLQTPGTGTLSVGYARVTTGGGVGGTAVFSRTDLDSGTLLFEAGVPSAKALSDFSLVVDSLGDRDTGLALVNPPGGSKATIQLRLYDQQFQLIAQRMVELDPGEHLPRFVNELFPSAAQKAIEMEGSVTVQSDVPLAAVTLRQNDDPEVAFPPNVPTLTTFPVIPGRSDLLFPPP